MIEFCISKNAFGMLEYWNMGTWACLFLISVDSL